MPVHVSGIDCNSIHKSKELIEELKSFPEDLGKSLGRIGRGQTSVGRLFVEPPEKGSRIEAPRRPALAASLTSRRGIVGGALMQRRARGGGARDGRGFVVLRARQRHAAVERGRRGCGGRGRPAANRRRGGVVRRRGRDRLACRDRGRNAPSTLS